jgi:hypothetical protein
MKDPCDDCLVKVCCGEICDTKKNYNALCQDALKYYKRFGMPHKSHIGVMAQYNEQYRKARQRDIQTFKNSNEIIRRKNERGR